MFFGRRRRKKCDLHPVFRFYRTSFKIFKGKSNDISKHFRITKTQVQSDKLVLPEKVTTPRKSQHVREMPHIPHHSIRYGQKLFIKLPGHPNPNNHTKTVLIPIHWASTPNDSSIFLASFYILN